MGTHQTTRIRCPKCGTPGANIGIWGSADLNEAGTIFEGDMRDMNVDWKSEFRCLNFGHCDFEGYKGDFEVDVIEEEVNK